MDALQNGRVGLSAERGEVPHDVRGSRQENPGAVRRRHEVSFGARRGDPGRNLANDGVVVSGWGAIARTEDLAHKVVQDLIDADNA